VLYLISIRSKLLLRYNISTYYVTFYLLYIN